MNLNSVAIEKINIKDILYDLIAISVIFLIPTISHLTSFPFYYFEPMRILLLASLVHTSKKNVYILTFLLPLFSFMISSHPTFTKAWLISSELTLNVFLFLFVSKFLKNFYISMLLSVLASKIYYYVIKLALINFGFISGELFTTPFIYQIVVTLVVTFYVGFFYKELRN